MPIRKDPEGTETLHLQEMVDFPGRRVLEVGCGDGRLTWRYAASAARVTGVDPDAAALRELLSARPESLREIVLPVQANSESLPFPKNTFDIAILAWSF
jgi:ubiquinone/menaquinone biosynthesis C-methylase UbiE